MAPTRTKTVKNKHAANKSGIKNSRTSKSNQNDVVVKSKRAKGKLPASQIDNRTKLMELLKKKRNGKTYSEKDLDIPKLNTITPVGVQKPKGKKKGKVFVDDSESMNTILAIVQAEKDGQIESKMIKARQMEEIRQARLAEAEKRESERQSKLDETKNSLRKKRRRTHNGAAGGDDDTKVGPLSATGTNAVKAKKKRVSFAAPTEG